MRGYVELLAETARPAAKPVLKWAGGKGQLIKELEGRLPKEIYQGRIKTYIEPFAGGGAFFFYLSARFSFQNICLVDINPELIILYNVIKRDAAGLVEILRGLKADYYKAQDRSEFYYQKRDEYNREDKSVDANHYQKDFIHRAALTVFLNRTCFNGLYRVNRRGEFNVPAGRYKNPAIFDENNILKVSSVLQNVHILCGDFTEARQFCDEYSFIYYDPPYRPIKKTSSFNSYSYEEFDDAEQRRLKTFFDEIHGKGARQMLSNSDPTNYSDDVFFDSLYEDYQIDRILAKRMINSNGQGRQAIREILITNYGTEKAV